MPNQQAGTSTNGTGGTSLGQAFGSNNEAGSLLIAHVGAGNDTVTVTSITDTAGNGNWVAVPSSRLVDSTNFNFTEVWYNRNAVAGANTVTVNFSASVGWRHIEIHEQTGLDTAAPLDTHDKQLQTGIQNPVSPDIIPSVAGCYIFGGTMWSDNVSPAVTWGASGSFTRRVNLNTASQIQAATEDYIEAGTPSLHAAFTTEATGRTFLTQVVAFKPAAAAPVPASISMAIAGTPSVVIGW